MATAADFRRLALAMPDAIEGVHMAHPDFRANGHIFATLHANGATGMVRLTPEQQRTLLAGHGDAFAPATGAWGRQGCTIVRLADVPRGVLREALTAAWQRTLEEKPARRSAPTARRTKQTPSKDSKQAPLPPRRSR